MLSLSDWHRRYQQQARWTHNLRRYVYSKVAMQDALKILDIGCGTGVLECELNDLYSAQVFGLDIDPTALMYASGYAQKTLYVAADGCNIPFPAHRFDITLCHFLLLWVKESGWVIREMSRVTRPGGYILALAEPDYGGRIDYPAEFSLIGKWQVDALIDQGANPLIGRELRSIFHQAGLENVEAGVLGGQWNDARPGGELKQEWQVIHFDLNDNIEFQATADKLFALDEASRQAGERILFVPTFYAIGRVPG